MLAMHGNKLFHATNLGPIRSLRQKRLGGDVPRTSAMVTCRVKDTDHIKLYYPAIYPLKMEPVRDPSFTMNDPNRRKSWLTFISLDKKCKSPTFSSACAKSLRTKVLISSQLLTRVIRYEKLE
jgi:hypothetical protein